MNVRTPQNTAYAGALERELIKAEIRKNGWLYWYWKPQSMKDRIDCGYSGISPDSECFEEMKARLLTPSLQAR